MTERFYDQLKNCKLNQSKSKRSIIYIHVRVKARMVIIRGAHSHHERKARNPLLSLWLGPRARLSALEALGYFILI